jgi:hypothetical protein
VGGGGEGGALRACIFQDHSINWHVLLTVLTSDTLELDKSSK